MGNRDERENSNSTDDGRTLTDARFLSRRDARRLSRSRDGLKRPGP